MFIAIVVGSVLSATYLIAWALCLAAKRGDRRMERERHGERLALQMDAFQWPEREES